MTPVLADLIAIFHEGSGLSGLLMRSISTSNKSFKAFHENMNVITERQCNAVIKAKSPLGRPWDAKIDPNTTPNIPVTEFPALNNAAHEARVA